MLVLRIYYNHKMIQELYTEKIQITIITKIIIYMFNYYVKNELSTNRLQNLHSKLASKEYFLITYS